MYKRGDFHLHTTASDGKLTPKELVVLGKNCGLDIMSITDHDNTFGVEEGIKIGESLNIKVIPGIELSTRYNGESIHILGYFKNDSYKDSSFQKFLKDIQDYRLTRAEKIVNNLKAIFNIDLDIQKLLLKNRGVIARPHIANSIIEAGYPYDFQYIFDNIIGNDCPAYVPNKDISIEEGLSILSSAGALTCLAHPTLVKKSPLDEILKYNFQCIEAIYPLNKKDEEEKFKTLAKKYNKIITAGSDYHGVEDEDKKHGYLASCTLEGEELNIFLEKLKSQ